MLYGSVEHRAKVVTSSAKLNHIRPFPGLFSRFFSLIESEISEQASRKIATEEGFHTQLDCKLTYGNKNKKQLTLV